MMSLKLSSLVKPARSKRAPVGSAASVSEASRAVQGLSVDDTSSGSLFSDWPAGEGLRGADDSAGDGAGDGGDTEHQRGR